MSGEECGVKIEFTWADFWLRTECTKGDFGSHEVHGDGTWEWTATLGGTFEPHPFQLMPPAREVLGVHIWKRTPLAEGPSE